jgi:glutathione S-transferase
VTLGLIPVLSFAQGTYAGVLRKAAKIPYPNAYASAQQVKESREAYRFNAAQRAHGNLLENMPQAMVSMLFAGLVYPRTTAALGLGWVVSRVIYAWGYVESSKPNGLGRYYGTTFWLCQAGVWGLCCKVGMGLLGGQGVAL